MGNKNPFQKLNKANSNGTYLHINPNSETNVNLQTMVRKYLPQLKVIILVSF